MGKMKDLDIDIQNEIMQKGKLMDAIEMVLISEDSTGCSEDLTVVSAEAIKELKKEYNRVMGKEIFVID